MNTKTIARNTAWYGLELLIGFGTSLITSIAIARTLGPAKMGYIIYVTWITGIVSQLSSVGIPVVTRKYMAEYLGGGDYTTARFIYFRTLIIQTLLASVATLGAIAWVFHDAPADYRIAALLLVIGILPSMSNFVSAQANVAAETLSANLPGSLASTATYFVLTLMAVFLNWGINGIAFAMFAMKWVDCLVRLFPTMRRIMKWDSGHAHPPEDLRARMVSFGVQSLTGMLLTLVVWDRSELFLLKHLTPDIRQLSFYSVAFSLAERLLIFPNIFASASGASIYAQYGRDSSRLPAMAAASARYLAMVSLPLHIIATPLAAPVIMVLYGKQYAGALVVASFAPLLCLPKAFLGPIQTMFESYDQQKYFITTTIVASFVDIGVAWLLIPSHGALGACLGSGAAQFTAVISMWAIGIARYKIRLPWGFFFKLSAISGVAALAAYGAVSRLTPLPGLIAGSVISTVLFITLGYMFKILEPEDRDRFKVITNACPQSVAAPINYLLDRFTRQLTMDSPSI
ncbi:oligosaccharide flippase family protein [Edaphobacter sp. 12200R-103]|uniref:oligosaccharide flippase family protein n=1 Tax=Edaphobacter sp. 12200R-103 TaxID=2703788 RepID=UPI00138BA4BC|nr:oligosaccharide flippase family protein [Edaphobacter sp. 12200R-103]QHS52246.1 oligosaccharide flippase family protein [Edaphobacter sp. 12200R-103]